MNFKTLFAVFSLALFGGINAAPVEIDTASIKKACKDQRGISLIQINNDEVSYACLNVYNKNSNNNKLSPEDSACYFSGEQILCVNEKYSNIESCSKSGNNYNYNSCSYALSYLNTDKVHLTHELRTYPDNDRIVFAPLIEQDDCVNENGVSLTYKTVYQYLCLKPSETVDDTKHCVTIKGDIYCVDSSKTVFNFCDKQSSNYDPEYCSKTLILYGRANGYDVEA